MAFYIGTTEFDDIKGDIILPTPAHDVESRSGQDGVVVFSTGLRGMEFELTTDFHVTTYAAAVTLMGTYYSFPSTSLLNIVRGTEDYTATDYRFVVLGVMVSIVPNVAWTGIRAAGRVSLSPAFSVVARWRMIAIKV
jgi:hypothetical protein